jgi:hypothetical protein
MTGCEVGNFKVRYGLVKYIKISGLVLLFLFTFFICKGGFYGESNVDYHLDELDNKRVTLTVTPGLINGSVQPLDSGFQVISNSTVSVNAEVKTQAGRYLFTVYDLLPGNSFYFEPEESSIVILVAS